MAASMPEQTEPNFTARLIRWGGSWPQEYDGEAESQHGGVSYGIPFKFIALDKLNEDARRKT
jgi:hypothetical protein